MSEKMSRPLLSVKETQRFNNDLDRFNEWANLSGIDTSKFDTSELMQMHQKGASMSEIMARAEQLAEETAPYKVVDKRHKARLSQAEDNIKPQEEEAETPIEEFEVDGVPVSIHYGEFDSNGRSLIPSAAASGKFPVFSDEEIARVGRGFDEEDIEPGTVTVTPPTHNSDEDSATRSVDLADNKSDSDNESEKENAFRRIRNKIGKKALAFAALVGVSFGLFTLGSENTNDETYVPPTNISFEGERAPVTADDLDGSLPMVNLGENEQTADSGYDLNNTIEYHKDSNKESRHSYGPALPTDREGLINDMTERIEHSPILTGAWSATCFSEKMSTEEAQACIKAFQNDADLWSESGKRLTALLNDPETTYEFSSLDGKSIHSSYISEDGTLLTSNIKRTNGTGVRVVNERQGVDFMMRTDCGGQVIQIVDGKPIVKLPGKELPPTQEVPIDNPKYIPTPEEPTPETPTPEIPKPEIPIPETPTPEEPTPEEPTPEEPTPETPTPEIPKPEIPIPETPNTPEVKDPTKDIDVNPDLNEEAVDTGGGHEVEEVHENTKPEGETTGREIDDKVDIQPDNGQAKPPAPKPVEDKPVARPVEPPKAETTPPPANHEGGPEVREETGQVTDEVQHPDVSEEVGPVQPGASPEDGSGNTGRVG